MTPIILEQRVEASPSTVFGYLVDGSKWSKWQGESAEIEPWPGGEFTMVMPDGARAEGTMVEIEQDRRIVFTWGWTGHPGLPPGSSRVEIELVEHEGGTRVILTHTSMPESERELHISGWRHSLSQLAMAAASPDSGPLVSS